MSLLLDARKKAQLAQGEGGDPSEHGPEEHLDSVLSPDLKEFEETRNAGRNLFNAKHPAMSLGRVNINRNLLFALGGTVLLLAAGAGYVWYSVSAGDSQPLRPNPPVVASNIKPMPTGTPQTKSDPKIVSPPPKAAQPARASRPAAKKKKPRARKKARVQIELQAEPIDPLLNDAYLAYRSGKFEQAQQLYRKVLNLDARNTDALLGMAVIAQHRGSDNEAAHYYSRTLTLDPRNAVANAGMSALTTNDNRESRLKNLLNEQQDSSSLHFALGNYYAGLERWGDAQQSYANSFRLEPDNAEIAFNYAVSLDQLDQKESAALHYQRALQLDKSHSAGFDHAQIEQRVLELTR